MSTAQAWLATYLVHSTVLLGAAWLVTRRVNHESWRELLWRFAMLGSLLTSSMALVPGHTPAAGMWRLEQLMPTALAPSPAAHKNSISGAAAGVPAPGGSGGEATPGAEGPGSSIRAGFFVLLAVPALLLLLRLWLSHARLQRMLADRRLLRDHPAADVMAQIARQASHTRPVRLSVSNGYRTPVALGGGEICVPARFLTELGENQQRVALAHELAHLVRRDPTWHVTTSIVEALLFFQPLNRVARRQLRQCAERLCDDWAVRQTGSALDLARCLAVVATWVGPQVPAHAPAFARTGSSLADRVERLLSGRPAAQRPSRVGLLGLICLIAATGVVAPAFTPRPGAAFPQLPAPERPEARPQSHSSPAAHLDLPPAPPRADAAAIQVPRRPEPAPASLTGTAAASFQPTPLQHIQAAVVRHYPEARTGALQDREVVFLVDAVSRAVLRTFTVEQAGIGAPFVGIGRRTAFTQYKQPADGPKGPVYISGELSDIHPDALPAFEIIGGGLLSEIGEVGVVVWYHVRGASD
jgi:beta-lactamase regulating signal transducer with metallopeptidase domain